MYKAGLLNLAEELQNISQACKLMRFSHDIFYRYKGASEEGGVKPYWRKPTKKPIQRNSVDPVIEDAVLKQRSIDLLKGKSERVMKDRLKSLEKHVAKTSTFNDHVFDVLFYCVSANSLTD